MMTEYLQPHQGIKGTVRLADDLLALIDVALPRRRMMANLAMALHSATLVGNPAPVVQRMYERMTHPQVGDLVLETSTFYRTYAPCYDAPSYGILLAVRDEWAQTDEEYAKDLAENLNGEQDGWRGIEYNVHYVQYGPKPADVYRWHNATFIMIPTEDRFEQKTFGDPTRFPGGMTFVRDDLVGGLADSGIEVQPPRSV